MNKLQKLNILISELTDELSNRKLIDKEEVSALLKTNFNLFVKILSTNNDNKITLLKEQLKKETNGKIMQEIQNEISYLKALDKPFKTLDYELSSENDYHALKLFIKHRVGKDLIEQFLEVKEEYVKLILDHKNKANSINHKKQSKQ